MNRRACIMLWLLLSLAPTEQVYADPASGLVAALHATLQHHPALRGKRAEIAAKGFAGDSARAQRYPTLSGQASAINRGNNNRSAGNYPMSVRARQPVWAFGRIDSGIAYADADQLAEEADLLRVKRQLMEQTAVAYAQVIGTILRVQVAQENIAALNTLYLQIARRHQGQLASQADISLALARLNQARAKKQRYEGERSVAESELLALTQVPIGITLNLPERLTQLGRTEQLKLMAQQQSADVRLKMQRIEVARANIDREKTAAMPTVYLQAERYFDDPSYGSDIQLAVVIEASLDGLGFTSRGRSNAAVSLMQASKQDLNSTRNEIARQVTSLGANRATQENLIASQQVVVEELATILVSYQRQYEAGYKAWLDVLNMQRELNEQQLQQVQAKNDWLIVSLKLAVLTGSLDQLVDIQETESQ
ncbi:TolC family protein [Agarivorans sp. QJM3NY_33]|uniref:TolC family protein n=1 Tax=Agarivorans sp. QJM3NY_33 TaxID=3421432 RepID=UPI003D7D604E